MATYYSTVYNREQINKENKIKIYPLIYQGKMFESYGLDLNAKPQTLEEILSSMTSDITRFFISPLFSNLFREPILCIFTMGPQEEANHEMTIKFFPLRIYIDSTNDNDYPVNWIQLMATLIPTPTFNNSTFLPLYSIINKDNPHISANQKLKNFVLPKNKKVLYTEALQKKIARTQYDVGNVLDATYDGNRLINYLHDCYIHTQSLKLIAPECYLISATEIHRFISYAYYRLFKDEFPTPLESGHDIIFGKEDTDHIDIATWQLKVIHKKDKEFFGYGLRYDILWNYVKAELNSDIKISEEEKKRFLYPNHPYTIKSFLVENMETTYYSALYLSNFIKDLCHELAMVAKQKDRVKKAIEEEVTIAENS